MHISLWNQLFNSVLIPWQYFATQLSPLHGAWISIRADKMIALYSVHISPLCIMLQPADLNTCDRSNHTAMLDAITIYPSLSLQFAAMVGLPAKDKLYLFHTYLFKLIKMYFLNLSAIFLSISLSTRPWPGLMRVGYKVFNWVLKTTPLCFTDFSQTCRLNKQYFLAFLKVSCFSLESGFV